MPIGIAQNLLSTFNIYYPQIFKKKKNQVLSDNLSDYIVILANHLPACVLMNNKPSMKIFDVHIIITLINKKQSVSRVIIMYYFNYYIVLLY